MTAIIVSPVDAHKPRLGAFVDRGGFEQLHPKAQAALAYGHGKTLDAKRSILHPDLKTVPHQPGVQVIGNGYAPSRKALANVNLKHSHHRTFHATTIPAENDLELIRFYCWHIDAALQGSLHPPRVTSLPAVKVHSGGSSTLLDDDGSNNKITVLLGTTVFVSRYTMFNLLTPAQQECVRTANFEYAPNPCIWMSMPNLALQALAWPLEAKNC